MLLQLQRKPPLRWRARKIWAHVLLIGRRPGHEAAPPTTRTPQRISNVWNSCHDAGHRKAARHHSPLVVSGLSFSVARPTTAVPVAEDSASSGRARDQSFSISAELSANKANKPSPVARSSPLRCSQPVLVDLHPHRVHDGIRIANPWQTHALRLRRTGDYTQDIKSHLAPVTARACTFFSVRPHQRWLQAVPRKALLVESLRGRVDGLWRALEAVDGESYMGSGCRLTALTVLPPDGAGGDRQP